MRRRFISAACAVAILALGASACAAMDRVSIHLKWFHSAQFAGLYAAEANGFFAREGLEVEFVDGPALDDVLIDLSEGAYDFVLADPTRHLSLASRGITNVAVAAVFQIDPAVIFSLEESGIRRAEDLLGKRVMFYPTSLIVPAVLGRVGLTLEDIETVPASYDLSDLYSGACDAWSGYYTSEVRLAREDGYDVNVIYPTDYGVHLYGDVLIARRDLVATDPDLVQRVVFALIEGWRWTLGHVEEAAELPLAWDPTLDVEEQRRTLMASLPFVHVGRAPLCAMLDEQWSSIAATMIELGLLPMSFDPSDVYTLDFVRPPDRPRP